MCVCTYHVRNNYVTYIVAKRPYLSRLLCVAAMSSLPQFVHTFPFPENKSDISYLKTSRAFDVLIHSGKPNSVG